ncbi:MAG: glycosyltransferase family 9 protein, partial [Nitrospiraceae bacterium]
DEQEVDRLLRRQGLTPSATWIAMSLSARWSTKRWPARSFAAPADHLQREGAGPVVLIGGAEEQGDVEEVKKFMVTKPIDLTGQTPVGLLPALLKTAAVLVTNDSGPMHIAAAVNTPVVSLFGPTSPTRTGPYGAGHAVLMYRIPCSPCFSRVCHNMPQLECLTSISPEQVLAAVRERLAVKLAH